MRPTDPVRSPSPSPLAPRWKRAAVPLATMLLAVGGAAIVHADSPRDGDTGLFVFGSGAAISSTEVNENFDVLGEHTATYEGAIHVDDEGRVGVNTTSPLSQLSVTADFNLGDARGLTINTINDPSSEPRSSNISFRDEGSEIGLIGYTGYSGDLAIQTTNDADILLNPQSEGFVGIGLTNPPEKLSVYGGGVRIVDAENTSAGHQNMLTIGRGIYVNNDSRSNAMWTMGIYQQNEGYNGENTSAHDNFYIGRWNGCEDVVGTEDIVITRDGNVGIGTTTPDGKLDVNGTIYQRGGQLHADYVFQSDYELESIEEHAAFMWSEQHLPAVPSAQYDKDGQEVLEVGAHRKGMLEELEKAHVYIEQLNDEVDSLYAERAAARARESRLIQKSDDQQETINKLSDQLASLEARMADLERNAAEVRR